MNSLKMLDVNLVRMSPTHWEYSKDKYGKYIYQILQIAKSDSNTYAILKPFLKSDWGIIEGPFISSPNYSEINPKKLIEVEIEHLEIIHHSEIPIDVIRDFKLNDLGI